MHIRVHIGQGKGFVELLVSPVKLLQGLDIHKKAWETSQNLTFTRGEMFFNVAPILRENSFLHCFSL